VIDGRAFAPMMWAAMIGFACIWLAVLIVPPIGFAFAAWLIEPRIGIHWHTVSYWAAGIWAGIFVCLNVWIWRS
jgi:hypothetical protein